MSKNLSTGQIRQLLEIDAKRPIGDHVQELIRRLTDGGVAGRSDDQRMVQAKRLWDRDVGTALGIRSFTAYLGTIPYIPAELLKDDAEFPLLVLVETRLGLKKLCGHGGVAYDGDAETFVAYDERHREFDRPTWIRVQDGRKNRNRSIRDCRKSFGKRERGLTALQGVCTYLHHPSVVSEATQDGAHIMDLSGSVLRDNRDYAACLKLWNGQPRLDWDWDGDASPEYGSASRRDC